MKSLLLARVNSVFIFVCTQLNIKQSHTERSPEGKEANNLTCIQSWIDKNILI